MEMGEGAARTAQVMLPSRRPGPMRAVLRRVGLAVALLLIVVVLVYVGRDGYHDGARARMSLLDCLYYATVTVSTTGYGDIVPVSAGARLVNTVIITPVRVLFLIVLVGTTLEVLAERTREDWRRARWRSRVRDHFVVAGFGTKGRSAVRTLLRNGVPPQEIVVVDPDPAVISEATHAGVTGVVGDATRRSVLRQAAVERAREIVVACARDDTAVMVTLTSRELNPDAGIQATVREAENIPLLRQSGADHVVVSSETAGRLLGVAALHPHLSAVMEDLLQRGSGLDLVEREVRPDEVGIPAGTVAQPVVAVVRDDRTLAYDDPGCSVLRDGDRLIVARSTTPDPDADDFDDRTL
ncbi:Ion channel protein [Actinomadura harenae]|uniref:Ion channel protein n=2 Tax=Actinomadura harenae TaxID=2483351 RepID=A0A3M2LRS7_9ACTN|nr:Ion channel protein [Actinomadura harenae]